MWTIGPLGFTAPLLLLGLLALPILWFILRAVPPAPIRRRFPGVALLLGLTDRETEADRTPWWLLLLRILAVASAILGFAGPVLNPDTAEEGDGPLLILFDGSWAGARDWGRRIDRAGAALEAASRAGRPVALALLTDPPAAPVFQAAEAQAERLPALKPRAWEPGAGAMAEFAAALAPGGFDTLWLSDGLDRTGRAALLEVLQDRGAVRVVESPRPVRALGPPDFTGADLTVPVLRAPVAGTAEVEVSAWGLDPAGAERELARAPVGFEEGAGAAEAAFDLPAELRNRVTRFQIAGEATAGAVALADDALKRRKVAVVAATAEREGLLLLSPTYYLTRALEGRADVIEGQLADLLPAAPDVVVLADVARLSGAEAEPLLDWIREGGLLLRFAGPRLAAAEPPAAGADDPLLPVRLRAGGRTIGGTMSWDAPKTLAPFPDDSPFFGLAVPGDVTVTAQVMAEPDPALAERTIATLADGTPLVTRRAEGQGQVVLVHVTANANWSNLPLSGLFVQMLDRLAISTRPAAPDAEDLAGTVWTAERVLDGFGALQEAGALPGVAGPRLADAEAGPDLPPGLYASGDRRLALNAVARDRVLAAVDWPASVPVEGVEVARETALKGWLLALALTLLSIDILAALWLAGRLTGPRAGLAAALLCAVALTGAPGTARAQSAEDEKLLRAASGVVLAHVLTGDAEVDRLAAAGLTGLSSVLAARTSVEPDAPLAVALEEDELSVLTLLYWPVTADQPAPSPQAYARLNRYLRSGGMILFDTRDGDVAGFGGGTPEGRRLQALAAPLDIPPLEPVPQDHVLTRTFYLLQEFPGRHRGRAIWVEAAPADAERAEGMPFRNLNDGVTPVVIGGNDWAAAWAVDERGLPMVPVGRGMAGERQREIALRFGVNLVMHVLTGNYKSDQVHVPALLERLGQ